MGPQELACPHGAGQPQQSAAARVVWSCIDNEALPTEGPIDVEGFCAHPRHRRQLRDQSRSGRVRGSEARLSKARGSYVDPALARVNVESWARDWLKSQAQLKPTTLVGYESALSKHIIPRWGRRSLSDIGYAEIQHWISDLSKTLAPQTVRNI